MNAALDESTLAREVAAARERGIDRDTLRMIHWAHRLLGDGLMMTTSFQKSGMIILDIVRRIVPDLPVYFLDTGFHFQETLDFAERIRRDWSINLILHRPKLFGEAFAAQHGKLYEKDPELCCHLNKVQPQRELFKKYQGWITGVRRDQAATREGADGIEVLDDEGPKLKIQPLAHWTRPEVEEYLRTHQIPTTPLYEMGYTSIGCQPCTQPCHDPSNERAGRWLGKGKVECGLHTFWQKRGKDAPAATPAPAPSETPAGSTPAAGS